MLSAMAKFFIPGATPEMAEGIYAGFVKAAIYPLSHPTARLSRISYQYQDRGNRLATCVAEVGKEPVNSPDPSAGPVAAIVASTNLIKVHVVRGKNVTGPLFVGPEQITEREYFEDYPAN
jgi:hypothetical protein